MIKTALITGAAQGLGANFAEWLAERGYLILLHYNQSEEEAGLLKEFLEKKHNTTCYLWQADLTTDFLPSLQTLLDAHNLTVDLLINNVGNFLYQPIADLTQEHINDVLETNFISAFKLCSFFIPLMRKRDSGQVLNLTCSGAERLVYRRDTAFYHYAKSGVHLLTQLWAAELADTAISINSIAPGVLPDSQYKETIPKRFWTSYTEVEAALDYLLSSEHSVNGMTFDLSNGWQPGAGL